MPLTEFQKQVLRLLASNRSPDSHVAGGTALNTSPASARMSEPLCFQAATSRDRNIL